MALSPLRLAILEADTPIDPILNRYGTYGDIFITRFNTALETLSSSQGAAVFSKPALQITSHDVVIAQEYPSLSNIDAILITGSQFTAFNDDPWIVKLVQFVKDALKMERIRVIGICFGHQILGRALGAKVTRGADWEVSVTAVDLTKKGQEIFGRPALAVQQMRRDIVLEYPSSVEELAYTSHCTHGMYTPKRLISIQGHPEYTGEMMRWLLESRHKKGVLNDAVFESGIERVDTDSDGPLVIQSLLEFLLE